MPPSCTGATHNAEIQGGVLRGGRVGLANARVVEAQDEQEAAERVCGRPLIARGKIGQLRAQVSPVSKPAAKTLFYVPA